MKYQKAKAEAISFDGLGIFTYTSEESAVHREGAVIDSGGAVQVTPGTKSAVIFQLEAERSQGGFTPEVQTTGNLEIGIIRRNDRVPVFVVVIVIDEEECVSPVVLVESFQGRGEVLTAEVVKSLEIGLRLGGSAQRQGCDGSDEDFFGHKIGFRKNYS